MLTRHSASNSAHWPRLIHATTALSPGASGLCARCGSKMIPQHHRHHRLPHRRTAPIHRQLHHRHRSNRNLRRQLNPQRLHHRNRSLQRRIAIRTKRPIELLPRQPGHAGRSVLAYPSPAPPRQAHARYSPVIRFKCLRHEGRDRRVRGQVFSRIINRELFGHFSHSISSTSRLAVLMSFVWLFLFPPQSRTTTALPRRQK